MIKGASGNMGGTPLQDIAFKMQTAGQSDNLNALIELLPKLEHEYAKLKVEMVNVS